MKTLVVVSWNMQGRVPERLRLADALAEWQPDVLLLQEADGDEIGHVLPSTFQSRLWWPTAATPPGIVIASHLALDGQALHDPRDAPWDRPRLAWARLRLDGSSLTVASCHLLAPLRPGGRARRDSQLQALATWAEGLLAAGERLVVAGDFNTRNPRLPRMTDVSGAAPLPTWRPLATSWLRPLLRLDAIFVDPGLSVRDAYVGGTWRGSDHVPVVARIDLS
jgi:endonuclease/exonuclease/phosphatase family metal-dependent hydrolase